MRTGWAPIPPATRSSRSGSCFTIAIRKPSSGRCPRFGLFNPGPAVYQSAPGPVPAGVSVSVIVPALDRTLRPEWMRQAARDRLGVEPVEVSAGHCPHVSCPDTIADVLTGL